MLFDGIDVSSLGTRELYALRMRMGMLFQNGALLTDEDVFENVAFPLREHTDLPECLIRNIVLTKLQAVGLRGAAKLMPAELSGGMARRVALARAMATDPEVLIYDEPFTGLDPISMGMIVRLVRQMNFALGITSIVVSHDVEELAILADASYIIAGGKVAASGSFVELKDHESEIVHQFINGLADGPVAVPLSRRPTTTNSCSRIRTTHAFPSRAVGQRAGLRRDRRRGGAVLRPRPRAVAARGDAPEPGHRTGAQHRRAVARHHHDVRTVRRHGARPHRL